LRNSKGGEERGQPPTEKEHQRSKKTLKKVAEKSWGAAGGGQSGRKNVQRKTHKKKTKTAGEKGNNTSKKNNKQRRENESWKTDQLVSRRNKEADSAKQKEPYRGRDLRGGGENPCCLHENLGLTHNPCGGRGTLRPRTRHGDSTGKAARTETWLGEFTGKALMKKTRRAQSQKKNREGLGVSNGFLVGGGKIWYPKTFGWGKSQTGKKQVAWWGFPGKVAKCFGGGP